MQRKNSLKQLRESLLIRKAELTRKAQISPFTVSRIEKGLPCHMETKQKIIPALGLEVSDKDRVFFESD
ncbi:MAG: XRE family transcriptional regulator [Deltaproteobacteria bacterium]|nr:XRE family transcriptional regulator [Deltaproteobacteria bacterium]